MSDVPEGYKMTEVGVIPEDWGVKEIEKEIDLLTGFPFQSNQYSSSGIRLLRCSNIKRGETDWSDGITEFWPKITLDLKSYSLNEGDIVIAMDGSLVGKSFARLSKKDLPALLLQRVARIRSNKIDVGYLKEFICSDYFTKYCNSIKTVTAIPHISPDDIRKFQIPLPPTIEEQQAIASALSDTDALITALEQLITKKRNIKKGAMQQLLTGEKRLPGFGGEWEVKTLGDIVSQYIDYRGRTPKKLGMNWGEGNILALSANNVQKGYIDANKEAYFGSLELYSRWMTQGDCQKGDVLLTMEAPLGNVAQIPDRQKYILSQRVILLKTKSGVVNNFLYHFLSGAYFQSELLKNSSGTTAQGIQRKKLDEILIHIPNFLVEQQAIATILSDMDTEIEALEQKQAKYKAIKQGMMQDLLTGKTRLV